jgi:hypothetical protein
MPHCDVDDNCANCANPSFAARVAQLAQLIGAIVWRNVFNLRAHPVCTMQLEQESAEMLRANAQRLLSVALGARRCQQEHGQLTVSFRASILVDMEPEPESSEIGTHCRRVGGDRSVKCSIGSMACLWRRTKTLPLLHRRSANTLRLGAYEGEYADAACQTHYRCRI